MSSRRKLTKLLTAGCASHSLGCWEAGGLCFSEESKAVPGNAAAWLKIVSSYRMPRDLGCGRAGSAFLVSGTDWAAGHCMGRATDLDVSSGPRQVGREEKEGRKATLFSSHSPQHTMEE